MSASKNSNAGGGGTLSVSKNVTNAANAPGLPGTRRVVEKLYTGIIRGFLTYPIGSTIGRVVIHHKHPKVRTVILQ